MSLRKGLAGVACAGLAVAFAVPAGADPEAGASATKSVSVQDNHFAPKRATAAPGDTIKFGWSRADTAHDVKFTRVPSGAKKPRKCSLRDSGTCKRKVGKVGTYKYICTVHIDTDDMRGSIKVTN